ncbi:hypothetical protein MXB_2450, partial [Myxobolus squamalis]
MAIKFKGGVVVAADSRTSSGSGSAADTQYLADIVRHSLRILKSQTGTENLVRSAANIFRTYCYDYRDMLSAGIIVAGYDHVNGGQIYSIPSGGMIHEAPFVIGGSGSIFLYSYFDLNYQENMTADQCINFARD